VSNGNFKTKRTATTLAAEIYF